MAITEVAVRLGRVVAVWVLLMVPRMIRMSNSVEREKKRDRDRQRHEETAHGFLRLSF